MRNLILKLAVGSLAAAGMAATPAAYAESSKEEAIGIGAGGVIGAFAGGPVGFFVGAALGAKLGDTLHRQDAEIETLTASLEASGKSVDGLEYDVRRLTSDIEATNAELEQLRRMARPELLSLLKAGIALDLLFRTDEHVLANSTGDRLTGLATSLAKMPDVHLQLDGFADERGDAAYNQQLSEKRVQFVRDRLLAAGIGEARISYSAHGESPAQDENLDSYALERRVSVKLFVDDTPSLASNPK